MGKPLIELKAGQVWRLIHDRYEYTYVIHSVGKHTTIYDRWCGGHKVVSSYPTGDLCRIVNRGELGTEDFYSVYLRTITQLVFLST
jgi:CRISPR/Cas system-associated endonuclease Cas3-HD